MVANTHLPPAKLVNQVQTAREVYTQYLSWQPLEWFNLLDMLKINVHMPLYYALLNPWLGFFGNSAAALRSFSVIWSTLALLPIYYLVQGLWGRTTALTAVFFMTVSPFQIYFAQEGRMYALGLFWSCLSTCLLWKTFVEQGKTGNRIILSCLYALSALAGVFTHYMAVFIIGFQCSFLLLTLVQSPGQSRIKHTLIRALPILSVFIIAAYLWFPVYKIQQSGIEDSYHFAKGASSWLRYFGLPFWYSLIFTSGDNTWARLFYFPLTIILLLSTLARSIACFKKTTSHITTVPGVIESQKKLAAWLLLFWFLVPILFQIGYDILKDTHTAVIDRYVMLCSPPVYIAMALGFEFLLKHMPLIRQHQVRIKPLILSAALLIGILTVANPSPFRDIHNKSTPIQTHLFAIQQRQPSPDIVVVNGPWGANLIAAYYFNQFSPSQQLLYWMSPYQGNVVPMPDTNIFSTIQYVWLFRYRANNERGLQSIKDYLGKLYSGEGIKIEDGFWYSRL